MTYGELVLWICKAASIVGLLAVLAFFGYTVWDMIFGPDDGS